MKLLKNEVLKEMEAVKCFIELAIQAQKAGYLKAAEFFLGQAREDCGHAFNYARELDKYDEIDGSMTHLTGLSGKGLLDKYDEVDGNMTITEIVQKYQELESGAVDRVLAIKDEIHTENKNGLLPFVLHMLADHSDEAYVAKKLLQKVAILDEQQALNDIEELFTELLEGEE